MDKKIRLYWSGRLHPGDVVFYQLKKCKVAGYVDEKKDGPVPAGHVPVSYCDVGGSVPVFTVPFDDLDVGHRA